MDGLEFTELCNVRRYGTNEKTCADLESTRAGVFGHEGARHERVQALGVHLGLQEVQQLLSGEEINGFLPSALKPSPAVYVPTLARWAGENALES